jgi:hypothetical protein
LKANIRLGAMAYLSGRWQDCTMLILPKKHQYKQEQALNPLVILQNRP